MHGDKICNLSSSLEFTIESHNGEDFVTYRDGKLSLTIPKELKIIKIMARACLTLLKNIFRNSVQN